MGGGVCVCPEKKEKKENQTKNMLAFRFFFSLPALPPPPPNHKVPQSQKAGRLPSLEGTPFSHGFTTLNLDGMDDTPSNGMTGGGSSPFFLSSQSFSGRTGGGSSPRFLSPGAFWEDWNRALSIQRRVIHSSYFCEFSQIFSIADCCTSSIASYLSRARAFGSNWRFKA